MCILPNTADDDGSGDTEAGKTPDYEDIEGMTPEEVEELLEDREIAGGKKPTRSGSGVRYPHPTTPGEQVRVMPGNPNDKNPVKRGPYAVISKGGPKGGEEIRVPLADNPTLPHTGE